MTSSMRTMWVTVLVGGCTSTGPTTEVSICGDLLTEDVELVRVVVSDLRDAERFSAVLAMAVDGEGVELPLVTEIPRQEGRGVLRVEARSDGLLAAGAAVRSGDLALLEAADFTLTQSCRGVTCPTGESCVASECVAAPLASEAAACP